MFDFTKDPLKDLRAFASAHSEALQYASLLLGGQPALRRTQGLLDDITSVPELTRRVARELDSLHQLLSLHNVHDADLIETACFADIDPASPIPADLRLLSEALSDQMLCLRNNSSIQDFKLLQAA